MSLNKLHVFLLTSCRQWLACCR